jgi:DNA helicase-2/ATP-dependent DNA helicase PcrA
MSLFDTEYKKLNPKQKEAVDAIEGPVMVVAGPGTGKTQILTLRIGNILKQTQVGPDGILCLTFTRSGVRAMKNRLLEYIGTDANKVNISTFHSFAIKIVEENYNLLDFDQIPKLLEEDEVVFLIDDILQNHDWQHLRPRNNPQMYFNDLKSLFSILKRENITVEEFRSNIEKDIEDLKNDPASISSRGESKGKLKKETLKKIEGFNKTLEVVDFYKIYEEKKKELALMDYDDALEYALDIVENSSDVKASIFENFLYVLVDEHQDSSGIQNKFLKAVWGEVENPNIFVVGDDRQLIYAFSGANLSYFEEFKNYFGKAHLITLVENYRSTERILNLAHDLLQSLISPEKLKSNKKQDENIYLKEYDYPRDEILGASLYFKNLIDKGENPEDMAILVPKNYHVRNATSVLRSMNLPVNHDKNLSLFSLNKTESFLKILNIIDNPFDNVALGELILDKVSNIEILEAHKFLRSKKKEEIGLPDLINYKNDVGLFAGENNISLFGKLLKNFLDKKDEKLTNLLSEIGNTFFIDKSENHKELLENVEFVRTFIHLGTLFEQKHLNPKIKDFLKYIARLKEYGNHIDVAVLGKESGIEVMTLHKSKGLEYKYVWIAHMNEEVLMSQKRMPFTLPEYVKNRLAKRDIEDVKRELYVAITRAKEFCTISYANQNYTGGELSLSSILGELNQIHFDKKNSEENERELLENNINGAKIFATNFVSQIQDKSSLEEVKIFVKENYKDSVISVSLLNNFFECPWKWYFRNFLKVPEVKSNSLALGSAVHNTIEYILKNTQIPKEKELLNFISKELVKEGVDDEKELIRLEKQASNIISDWLDSFYKNLEREYKSERSVSFKDKDLDISIYGKLDLTEWREDKAIIITDFKTGKPKTKNEIEKIDEEGRLSSYMRQLVMYAYLVCETSEKYPEICKLLFLEADKDDKNKIYATSINTEQIDLLKRDIEEYVLSLENTNWIERKCNFKPFGGKNDPCPNCALAQKIFLK